MSPVKTLRKLFPKDPFFGYQAEEEEFPESHAFQDGLVYLGDFSRKGKANGQGKMNYPTPGHSVKGHLIGGSFNGLGEMHHPSGISFKGMFKNNKAKGYGVFCLSDGGIRLGSFASNCLTGLGYEKLMDKTEFFGHFVKNRKEGIGLAILPCKHQILSVFKNNALGRYAYYSIPDLLMYEGEMQNEKFHGKGRLKLHSGEEYNGNFVDGTMHGKGHWIFKNGNEYEGEFESNCMHGRGFFYSPIDDLQFAVLCDRGSIQTDVTKEPAVRSADRTPPVVPRRPEEFRDIDIDANNLMSSALILLQKSPRYGDLKKRIKEAKHWVVEH